MDKIKRLIGLIAILAILITGCIGGGEKEDTGKVDINTGKKALDISFKEGYPPERARSGDQIDILVDVTNYGKADADTLFVLTGLPQPITQSETILGKETTHKSQEKVIVDFGTMSFDETQTLGLAACYEYKTEMKGPFCVGTQELGSACKKDYNPSAGQGAPVQITKIAVDSLTRDITIQVRNVESGKVTLPSAAEGYCDGSGVNPQDENSIRIERIMFGDETCQVTGARNNILSLSGNVGEIICTFNDLPDTKIEKMLDIELSYGYSIEIPDPVRIEIVS